MLERKLRQGAVLITQFAGNHGQELRLSYDKRNQNWKLELRPKGPGSVVLHINDLAMRAIIDSYHKEVSGEGSSAS